MNNILVLITALLLMVTGTASAQNTVLYPARSVDELKLMNEKELAREANGVCNDIVINNETAKKFLDLDDTKDAGEMLENSEKGEQYLQRIGLVIRDRHKGKSPVWFKKMTKASTFVECDAASQAGGFLRK